MKTVKEHDYFVIYGGQYGSEGKASAAEFLVKNAKERGDKVTVVGENSPNSGHTCSKGATKNIPATSYFANNIFLGPDAVIDIDVLLKDWESVGKKPLFIHENAAVLNDQSKAKESDLVKRISSTGSGSGMARERKFIERQSDAIIKGKLNCGGIHVVDSDEWMNILKQAYIQSSMFLECSQGSMLDTNFGVYPYCTSRSTLPRVAVERNGMGWIPWKFAGVYRTYPIRTGGPSGPTGGKELTWESLGLPPEIATVTKRIRRVFEFSTHDFCRSIELNRPDVIMFTFLDYIGITDLDGDLTEFFRWLEFNDIEQVKRFRVYVSNSTGKFRKVY